MKREESIGYRIRLIHNQLHREMEIRKRANEGNLTGMQHWAIMYLKEHEDCDVYQKDLEEAFKVSRATASNMLQVMERENLIRRVPVAHDARLKKLELTERARNMVVRADTDMNEMERKLENGFTPEEVKLLKEYLDRLIDNIGGREAEKNNK